MINIARNTTDIYLFSFFSFLTLPDTTRVILTTRDNRISFIIESTREDLIGMAFQHLQTLTTLGIPDATGLITTCGEDTGALWIEADLADLTFMTYACE